MRRTFRLGVFVSLGFCLSLGFASALAAANPIERWRAAADRTRMLAENDVPEAYAEAQKLQATLPADATAGDRARAQNLLARVEIYLGLTEQADSRARLALDLAKRNRDRVGEAEANLNLTLSSVNLGKIDALIAASTEGIAALDGVNRPDLLGEALLWMTLTYRRMDHINEAVAMSLRAMEIARHSNNPLVLAYAHQGLGVSFAQSSRFSEAREHYSQMLEQARSVPSKLLEGTAMQGMAFANNKLGDSQTAEVLFRKAIALYREAGAPLSVNAGLFSLANYLRDQHRFAEVAPLLNEVVATYERYPTRIGLWYALNARSSNEQDLGKLASAEADAEHAYEIIKQLNFPLYLSQSDQRLAELAAARGEYKRAYEFSRLAAEMTAKAANEKASAEIVNLTRRYEAESRQRDFDNLTHRNQQQAADIRQKALQERWLQTVLGSITAIFACTAFFLIRLRRSHKMLGMVHAELQRSLTARIQAEEAVRALNTSLEQRVEARTRELQAEITERKLLENQLVQAQKLESIGQLAAGIAHEINTPIQYIGDSVEFLRSAVTSIDEVLVQYRQMLHALSETDATGTMLAGAKAAEEAADLDFLHVEIPLAFERALDGVTRVAKIVRAMKEFAFPNAEVHSYANINHALETTLLIAHNEYKQMASVAMHFGDLPEVKCNVSELNQVFLNLIINAAHAIQESGKDATTGVIAIRTSAAGGLVEIAISDNGCGIAPENANKVFDPFFTTKPVGRGTGQGLSIARAAVVTRHGGTLTFESEVGRGSTFFARVPIDGISELVVESQGGAMVATDH